MENEESTIKTEIPLLAEKISRRAAIKRIAAVTIGMITSTELIGCVAGRGGGYSYSNSYGSYGYSSYSDYYSSSNSYYSNNFRPNSYFYGSYNAYSSRSYR